MADSLDDFFAKKDKKRGKDKGKASFSAGALVKELEEGSRQTEYPVRKETKTSTAIELLGLDADDTDWRDFEDVEKRDYSGLKVKEMSLQDQNEDEQRRATAELSEPIPESTPWKIKDETSSANADSTLNAKSGDYKATDATVDPGAVSSSRDTPKTEGQPDEVGTSAKDSAEKKGDTQSAKKPYVPPQARAGVDDFRVIVPGKLSKAKSSNSRYGADINIKDEQDFPSLG